MYTITCPKTGVEEYAGEGRVVLRVHRARNKAGGSATFKRSTDVCGRSYRSAIIASCDELREKGICGTKFFIEGKKTYGRNKTSNRRSILGRRLMSPTVDRKDGLMDTDNGT